MNAVKFALLGLVGVIGLVISTFGPFKIPYAETLAKTYYRYAIAGLLVVVALFAVLIAVLVHVLDPNQFKSQIIRYVQERTQRELILEGELELSWFPKLGVKAGKASLSQHRSAREFAAVDSARITLAWLPLLRRQVQVDSAQVDGLRAQLVRFKDGSTNIDDLLRDVATISPAHIDIDSLQLTRATLQWNDEVVFQRGSLNDLQLTLGRLTDGLAAPVTASLRVDAPYAGVDARVSLNGRVLFDAPARRIELAKIDAQLEGKSLGVDNLALNLKADLTGHFGLNTVSVENLVITSSSKSGLSVFNARLAAPELRLIERRFQGSQLSMDLSVAHPDQTLTAALQVPNFEGTGQALRGAAANAQISIRGAGTQLRAQLSSPVMLDFETGKRLVFDAIDLTAAANHALLSAETPLTANGKLVLDLAQQSMHLVLAGKLSGSDLRGQLAMSDWRRPHWTFEFASAGLDLDALLAQPCLARWGDDTVAFDVAYLRDLSLAGHLQADKVKLCGMTASKVSAQFDSQKSALHIAPVTALAYGGALDLAVSIDAE
ncbi:MAG: AsmA family protein, partial [Burkholderiaceae bacterium]